MTQRFPLQPDHTLRELEFRVQLLEAALHITPGKKIVLEYGDTKLTMSENEIVLAAKKIILKAEVEIVQDSNEVLVKASGGIQLKAGGNLVLKGAKIIEN